MKKITALFLVMMFIISTLGIQNVVAADNFNWNNLRAEYVYNSSRDELEIKIFLPSITRSPDERYDLEVEIDNRDYDKRMSYSSSQDEVYAIFDFDNINSSELDDYLDLDIKIEDEDRDEVFDGRIEMSSNGSMDNNSDDLDWDELDVDYSYSESSERLSITLELNDVNSSPRFRYTAMLESDNRDYEKTMTYSSSRDELKTTFTINNVDEDDLEDYLDIELEIEDNQNVTVYQEDIDLEDSSSNNSSNNNSDDLDWGDLDVSYTYSESSERLSMTVLLEDVNRSPRFRYTAMLESDNRDYEKTMTYSSSRDELKTTFTINNVDEDDLEDYLDIELEIEDNQNTTVYKKDIDLEDSSSNNSSNNNDRYSWEDLKYSVVYEKDKNRLNVGLQLDNINNAGNPGEYNVRLTIDGRTYNLKMFYSGPNRNFYTYKYIPVFSESRVKSNYNIGIQVKDEDEDIVYSTRKRVTTNKNGNSTTTTNTNTGTNTTVSSDEIEVKAFRYIYRVEQKFVNPIARAAYLNRTIVALESARYSLNATVVDGIIDIIRARIAGYNTGTSNSGNTYTPTTSTRVNKAETIISDGQGGTFKYVGGYNY